MIIFNKNDMDYEYVGKFLKHDFAVIPTDTLYALSISIYSENAYKIFKIKKRESRFPVPVGINSLKMMEELAEVPDLAERILNHVPKGGVTLVLKNLKVPEPLCGNTVGLRIPDHEVPLKLIELSGPITLTSANIHGGSEPVKIETAIEQLGGSVFLYVDYGILKGISSTVISIIDNKIKLIRDGVYPYKKILELLNRS